MTPEEIAQLKPDEIAAIIAEKDKQLDSAADIITEQSGKLDTYAKGGKPAAPTVEVDGKKYPIMHGVKLDGTVYTPALIAENADVAKKLVERKSSALGAAITEDGK